MSYIFIQVFCLLLLQSNIQASEITWGDSCPTDCECQITLASQTLISRWKEENSTVKTAFCLIKNESSDALFKLPNDTESLTFLQTNDENQLVFIRDMFVGLSEVKSIDVQGPLSNALSHITNDVFHDLKYLKYLSLQRVDITEAEKVFSKLESLEVLYVIYCTVGYLKWEMLDGLKNLKELYFVQSGIKELYGFTFYGTPELRRLFLSHNDLFSVEADAFVGLLKLEYLDLSNNNIDHLSGLTFPPLPHLQWLELKHNPIKVIFPHCFQYLNGTQHLTLGHKKQPVHLMKFSFRGLYSLIYLHIPNIDNDALFEHMFYDLRSLLHLNLQGRIKIINNRAFNGANKHLKKLILHNCQLERIFKDSFYGLEELHYLDLSSNLLKSLPSLVFNDLKSIHQIKLNNNQLKHVSHDLFLPLHKIKSLTLYGNPWNCSCEMQYWKEEMITTRYEATTEACNGTACYDNYILIYDKDYVPRCEFPENQRGKNVFLILKTMSCDKKG